MINYYDVLEISSTASKEDIKEAYKKISVKVHPDKFGGDEYYTELFQVVNDAKLVLTDELKRAEYDHLLKKSLRSNFHSSPRTLTRLNKKWTVLLSLSFLFLIVIILLPAAEVKQFEQKQPASATNFFIPKKAKTSAGSSIEHQTPVIASLPQNPHFAPGNSKLSVNETPIKALLNRPGYSPNNASQNIFSNDTNLPLRKETYTTTGKESQSQQLPEKTLDDKQMLDILAQLNMLKEDAVNNINCVKVLKTRSSNVENAFEIATLFSDHGFIIAGREIVRGSVKGAQVTENEGCFQVTIGSY